MAKDISGFSDADIKVLKRTEFLCESCYKKLGYPVCYDIDKEGFYTKDGIHAVGASIGTTAAGIGGAAAGLGVMAIPVELGAYFLCGPPVWAAMAIGGLIAGISAGKKAFEKIKCKCASLCTSTFPNNIAKYKYNKDKEP